MNLKHLGFLVVNFEHVGPEMSKALLYEYCWFEWKQVN